MKVKTEVNKGGRRTLPERVRLKVRPTRFSDLDWVLIKKAAKLAGLHPLSYVRIAVLVVATKLITRAKRKS